MGYEDKTGIHVTLLHQTDRLHTNYEKSGVPISSYYPHQKRLRQNDVKNNIGNPPKNGDKQEGESYFPVWSSLIPRHQLAQFIHQNMCATDNNVPETRRVKHANGNFLIVLP